MTTFDTIVNLSYAYFASEQINTEQIRTFIARMKLAFPEEPLDEDKLFSKISSILVPED